MKTAAILMLACLLTSCGAPADRLTDQQANAARDSISDPAGDDGGVSPSSPSPVTPVNAGAALYKAVGNEPGWSLTVGRDRIDYLGNYGEIRFSEPTPEDFRPGVGNFATPRLKIAITAGPCSDGMSDLIYRHTVRIVADNQPFSGCGGGTIAPGSLANSSWTIVAVNGRRTGGGQDFYLQFTGDSIGAKFGCNAIGGPFRQNGDHLTVPSLEQTLIGCPEPSARFEREGSAVLRSNMRVEGPDGVAMRLVSEAGSIDLKRAI